jgi:hypothetical protein
VNFDQVCDGISHSLPIVHDHAGKARNL